MSNLYQLIFKGEVIPPTNQLTAKRRLATLLNVEPASLSYLFSGKSYVLHQNIDESMIESYEIGMQKIGLKTQMISMDSLADATKIIDLATETIENTVFEMSPINESTPQIEIEATIDTFNETLPLHQTDETDEAKEILPQNQETPIIADKIIPTVAQKPLQYAIIFNGILRKNADPELTKSKFKQIMNFDDSLLTKLFNGNIHIIKSGLGSQEAEALMLELHKIGLDVNVKVERQLKKENRLYRIIFKGQILDSFMISDCIQKFASLCRTNEENIQGLFNLESHYLKSKLPLADAQRYIKALLEIGMVVNAEEDI